jgi:hypothetical protein
MTPQRRHPGTGRFLPKLPTGSSMPKPASPTPMGRVASGRPEQVRERLTPRARQARSR